MSWGLVARCDLGGLGNLSREIAAHLHPDRILFVLMPGVSGRGDCNKAGFDPLPAARRPPDGIAGDGAPIWMEPLPEEFVAGYHQEGQLDIDACQAFLDGLDAVLGLETWYDPRFPGWAKRAGATSHLYAMRELLSPGGTCAADRLWLPEPCFPEMGLGPPLREWGVLPWPASPERARIRPRPGCSDDGRIIWLHQPGAAMEDRNGTQIIRQALAMTSEPHTILSLDGPPGIIEIEQFGEGLGPPIGEGIEALSLGDGSAWHHVGFQPDFWPEMYMRGDCLLLPRRYGYLSLPPIEAAAMGVPTIMTALPPQAGWPLAGLIGAGNPRPVRMKGGTANVWEPSAADLALMMDGIAREPQLLAQASLRAQEWAEERSWEKLGPLWRQALEID